MSKQYKHKAFGAPGALSIIRTKLLAFQKFQTWKIPVLAKKTKCDLTHANLVLERTGSGFKECQNNEKFLKSFSVEIGPSGNPPKIIFRWSGSKISEVSQVVFLRFGPSGNHAKMVF